MSRVFLLMESTTGLKFIVMSLQQFENCLDFPASRDLGFTLQSEGQPLMFEREDLMFGTNPSCSVYYDCFACRRQLVIHSDGLEGYDHEDGRKEAIARGWFRRKFHEGADPWFCSKGCAYDSSQAKYCEESWAKEIKEYDEKNSIFGKIKAFFK